MSTICSLSRRPVSMTARVDREPAWQDWLETIRGGVHQHKRRKLRETPPTSQKILWGRKTVDGNHKIVISPPHFASNRLITMPSPPAPTPATKMRSDSVGSATCTPHASFSQQWVCDCCGSTTFDYENRGEHDGGCFQCEHEERSLHFVKM